VKQKLDPESQSGCLIAALIFVAAAALFFAPSQAVLTVVAAFGVYVWIMVFYNNRR